MVHDCQHEDWPCRKKRGFALGFNEFSGYFAVAVVGFVTGYLASIYGPKPYPFYHGIIFAIAWFLISWLIVKDTKKLTVLEIENHDALVSENKDKDTSKGDLSFNHAFIQTSWKNRSLLAVSRAGLANNLIFGVSLGGLFILYFSSFTWSTNGIGLLKAMHLVSGEFYNLSQVH